MIAPQMAVRNIFFASPGLSRFIIPQTCAVVIIAASRIKIAMRHSFIPRVPPAMDDRLLPFHNLLVIICR
jgi:hypothetical protein